MERRVELAGKYDSARQDELRALLDRLPIDGPVVLDVSNVTNLDTYFMEEVVRLSRRLRTRKIRVTGANAYVRRLLQMAGFDRKFHVD
jgi:anti-anti-sigma regulatory factor